MARDIFGPSRKLNRRGIRSAFDAVGGRTEVCSLVPDPGIYQTTLLVGVSSCAAKLLPSRFQNYIKSSVCAEGGVKPMRLMRTILQRKATVEPWHSQRDKSYVYVMIRAISGTAL